MPVRMRRFKATYQTKIYKHTARTPKLRLFGEQQHETHETSWLELQPSSPLVGSVNRCERTDTMVDSSRSTAPRRSQRLQAAMSAPAEDTVNALGVSPIPSGRGRSKARAEQKSRRVKGQSKRKGGPRVREKDSPNADADGETAEMFPHAILRKVRFACRTFYVFRAIPNTWHLVIPRTESRSEFWLRDCLGPETHRGLKDCARSTAATLMINSAKLPKVVANELERVGASTANRGRCIRVSDMEQALESLHCRESWDIAAQEVYSECTPPPEVCTIKHACQSSGQAASAQELAPAREERALRRARKKPVQVMDNVGNDQTDRMQATRPGMRQHDNTP